MGYAAPSSACTRASRASMTAASTQESNDAGPASLAAVSAPSSQPDPMIEPRDANMSPQNPTSLHKRFSAPTAPVGVVVAIPPPLSRVRLSGARFAVRPAASYAGQA